MGTKSFNRFRIVPSSIPYDMIVGPDNGSIRVLDKLLNALRVEYPVHGSAQFFNAVGLG